MKPTITILISMCFFTINIQAQTGLETVLSDIAKNNKTLQTQVKYWDAQVLKYKTGITIYDPTISYDFMYGIPNSVAGNQTDINIIQRFDFPTVYTKKKKLADEQSKQAELAISTKRQDILLSAKKICIELIYRNKLLEKLEEQKEKTETLIADYQTKLLKGDGTILDVNKVKLQLISINKDYLTNIYSIKQLNLELTELNGGIEIIFNDTVYPDQTPLLQFDKLIDEIQKENYTTKFLEQQRLIAEKQIEVSKALSLPKLEAGYHYQGVLGQNFHGGKIGMSIPLWENKNRIKHSKADWAVADIQLIEYNSKISTETMKTYEKCRYLYNLIDEYRLLLINTNAISVLDKALLMGGITTIQYFLETNFYYEAYNNFLLAEMELNQTIAELNKYKL